MAKGKSKASGSKTTPMMKQYRQIRRQLSEDTILFFRLGDFYEMFFEDAITASEILDIALTKRNQIPMCGIPFHAAEGYLPKLIRAGRKVAICEQTEEAGASKGIVQREVVRIITPGTVVEENVLDSKANNWLAGLVQDEGCFGLALLDLSTGTFTVEEADQVDAVYDNLRRYAPPECIVPEEGTDPVLMRDLLGHSGHTVLTPHDDWCFEFDAAEDLLRRHFQVRSLQGFGVNDCPFGLRAAGAVLHYVSRELRRSVSHIHRLQVRHPQHYLVLDEATIANLELIQPRNSADRGRTPTLLSVLDTTRTAMGGRMLRDWIVRPLATLDGILDRQGAVDSFIEDRGLLDELRQALGEIKDLERLISRLNGSGGGPRDLRSLSVSLAKLPELRNRLESQPGLLGKLAQAVHTLPELRETIDAAIEEEPPARIKDGGVIRSGYHEELDALRAAATEGRQWLADFQAQEQERTGIKSLKIRHNKVFGYYIEVTRANLHQVPESYQRKQTMANAERFITPELKDVENKILGAQDRSVDLESELFQDIRSQAVARTRDIQTAAEAVAAIDVLATLAERSLTLRYVRPLVHDGTAVELRDARHPVIEQIDDGERFVPNDVSLDNLANQLIIITGPNMAGKSTYIRQVAMLVILAQIGSYVPAAEASIGLVDRVFTRVGASDDLARGRSTFLVEMEETANILNNATPRSLIVLDEIGRGTSTFDGISIAWAVAEFLHNESDFKAKTLFATHYHELTALAQELPGVQNYSVLVKESGDKIAFLRKIVPGAADKSYGIQVAKLAGLPSGVIKRAKQILGNLEASKVEESGQPVLSRARRKAKDSPQQMDLFSDL